MDLLAHDPADLLTLSGRVLPTRWAGRPLRLLAQTGSTNDEARAAALAGAPHGLAVVADAQTSGRGRRGRSWHSPPGTSLYLSLLLRPKLRPADAPVLALAAGLAVRDALAPLLPGRVVTIKWPNDVRVDGRKVAGVLVEGSVRGEGLSFAVVGVGVNVNAAELPEELRAIATSVRIARGAAARRDELLVALLRALEDRVDALARDGAPATVAAVAEHCDTLGSRVRVEGVEGAAVGITDDGALSVRRDDGAVVAVRVGDVERA